MKTAETLEEITGSSRQPGLGFLRRAAAYGISLAIAAFAAAGCDDDNGSTEHNYPEAELALNPSAVESPYTGDIECDASASAAGDWPIVEYRFDFDNDGIDDYIEDEFSAPDGTFDGKATMPASCPGAGDYPVSATVMDSAGNESSATANLGAGYGADKLSAENFIEQTFLNASYDVFFGTAFQVLDPSTGQMVSFIADVEGVEDIGGASEQSTHVIYDSNTLSQEQKDCIANRAAATPPLDEPMIRVVEPDYSPNTIENLILN